MAQKRGNSLIMQMIEDVNNEIDINKNLKDNRYGYVPMSPSGDKHLIHNETGHEYDINCTYSGAKMNLYNRGSQQEWIDLAFTFDPDLQKHQHQNFSRDYSEIQSSYS